MTQYAAADDINSPQRIANVIAGEQSWFLVGEIVYVDIIDAKHRTQFCFKSRAVKRGMPNAADTEKIRTWFRPMDVCDKWNSAD
jgi:hypothetical protein